MADNLLPTDAGLASAVVLTIGAVDEYKVDANGNINFNLGEDALVKFFGESGVGTPKNAIEFQFPPKVSNDNRTGTWQETLIPGDQPTQIITTAGARKWTLEWTYVVGAAGWSVGRVKRQILMLRNYYTASGTTIATHYIVMFKMWKIGGRNPMTCRLGDIDISYGKALYVPQKSINVPDYDQAYPVITNVKVNMQLWTRGNAMSMGIDNKPALTDKIGLQGLTSYVPISWQ